MGAPRSRNLRSLSRTFVAAALLSGAVVSAQPAGSDRAGADATATGGASASPSSPSSEVARDRAAPVDAARAEPMRRIHGALARRRLGSQVDLQSERELGERVATAEELTAEGRLDESIAALSELVEHPSFRPFAASEPGRAAVFALGDALGRAGIHESARAYLRQSLAGAGAWSQRGAYARRAVRRLVEIALEARAPRRGLDDLRAVPDGAPPEIRGEVAYLEGRALELEGDANGAVAAYGRVPQSSRFWAQATYLAGLVHVEQGRLRQGEALFCKVADPKRQDRTAPVFADEHFFAVRDLARLALGRVAHEESRFDDARYYYYLVPQDSNRLAEALYESATSRYEKKDYAGARELLDELSSMRAHHRYEDEARILGAYVDLAECKFDRADATLKAFVARYEPLRGATRRIQEDPKAVEALLSAARAGADASATPSGATVTHEELRAIAALVRVDPLYTEIATKRRVLEREQSGLAAARKDLRALSGALGTAGGVLPADDPAQRDARRREDASAAVDGIAREVEDLAASGAAASEVGAMRAQVRALRERLAGARASAQSDSDVSRAGADLPDLLVSEHRAGERLTREMGALEAELQRAERALATDALHRLDLRLSRLLRRARLGRIESVLGRKRALEVEIEAIREGFLPADAVDSLDAARYLGDQEEYWPFEGDDWPDEYVGAESAP